MRQVLSRLHLIGPGCNHLLLLLLLSSIVLVPLTFTPEIDGVPLGVHVLILVVRDCRLYVPTLILQIALVRSGFIARLIISTAHV